MNLANGPVSMDRIADVLESIRKKGVRLWLENGELHYMAPKGALTQEEIERLRISKVEIVSLLERTIGAEIIDTRLEPRPQRHRAPLTFSQLAHWHSQRLNEGGRSIREIASATRLRGRLHLDALRRSVDEIIRRHDALRTRIVVCDGIPTQEIADSGECRVEVDDLTVLSEHLREVELKRQLERLILEPIDVAVGPLFGVRLLKVADDEHVLIAVMEHMIADELSLSILARDIFAAYVQTLSGRAISLPAIPIQFADYAVWQRLAEKSLVDKHGAYWKEYLIGSQRLRFPEDGSSDAQAHPGWGTVPLRIGNELKAELLRWCRLRRTTPVMSVFTAYVGLVLRWCDAPESVFQYVIDGRPSPNVENTIGFFASEMYPRIGVRDDDTFFDLLNRVTEEYCKAYEHADAYYIASRVPRPEFTRNTSFNWLPQRSEVYLSGLDGSEDAITCSPVPFAHPMVRNLKADAEPSVALSDTGDEIVGDVYFPLDRFTIGTMSRFGRNFLMFIETMLRKPESRVKDILLL